MRRHVTDDPPRAAHPDGAAPASARAVAAGAARPARTGRAPAAPPRLRLTRRGVVVLGTAAVVLLGVLVALVVLVTRLVGGGPEPRAVPDPVPVLVPVCDPDPALTQNCWPAIMEGNDPRLEVSPWVTGRLLAGDVRTVLEHVATRFDAEVEPVDVDSSWGWAYRSVRGEEDEHGGDGGLSNHASGTSIDLNATEHPLGATDTFSDDELTAIRAILAEVAPVVAWGGDFGGRADEMHFEIVGDPAAVAEVAARLRGEPATG
ncbi:M15 family metallopeptidase [Cellulomonas sp. Marseille-Q8402]